MACSERGFVKVNRTCFLMTASMKVLGVCYRMLHFMTPFLLVEFSLMSYQHSLITCMMLYIDWGCD